MRRLREADQRRRTGEPPLQVGRERVLGPARGPHLQARFHRPARDRGWVGRVDGDFFEGLELQREGDRQVVAQDEAAAEMHNTRPEVGNSRAARRLQRQGTAVNICRKFVYLRNRNLQQNSFIFDFMRLIIFSDMQSTASRPRCSTCGSTRPSATSASRRATRTSGKSGGRTPTASSTSSSWPRDTLKRLWWAMYLFWWLQVK